MTKKKTKKQIKEEEERDQLRWRVADIMSGACGMDAETEDFWPCVEDVPRMMAALRDRLGTPDVRGEDGKIKQHGNNYLFEVYNVNELETVEKMTDFLYRSGVRA